MRSFIGDGSRKTDGNVQDMFGIEHLKLPKIVIVAPTNNAVDVIEEHILQEIPMFNAEMQQFEGLITYYRLNTNEFEMRTSTQADRLQNIRQRSIINAIIDRLQSGITLCTIGLLYSAFTIQDLPQRAFRPYRRIIIDGASKVADRDMYFLLEYIHRFSPPGNIEDLLPSTVYIDYPYKLRYQTPGQPSM